MSVFTFLKGIKNGFKLTKSSGFNTIKTDWWSVFGGELLETRNEIKKK